VTPAEGKQFVPNVRGFAVTAGPRVRGEIARGSLRAS
jgi:hypothetical protein